MKFVSYEIWYKSEKRSQEPKEEGREGRMSLSCSKVRNTLITRAPKAHVCCCIFNSSFDSTLPVFSTTSQVMGLIWTACPSWQWSVSVSQKTSVPEKHLFCYFIWLYSVTLRSKRSLRCHLPAAQTAAIHMQGALTWAVHEGEWHDATTWGADGLPYELEAKLRFLDHQVEFLLVTA